MSLPMVELIAPFSYWVLTGLWLTILALYVVKLRKSKVAGTGIAVLLTILAIDAFRTVFESVYFGLFQNSRIGLLPPEIFAVLSQPGLMAIPKLVNVGAGVLVLLLLMRNWIPDAARDIERTKRNEAVLRSVFDDAAVGMVLHAPDGSTRERVNDAFCRLVGFTREELLNNPYEVLTHPEDLPRSLEMRRLLAEGEVTSIAMEKRYVHKDGHEVWGGVSSSVIRDEDGQVLYYVSFIEDISARKEAERSLKKASEEAMEASRAKSRFLATMSHEFRTPLNAILGFSEMLRSEIFGPLGDSRYRDYAESIRDSGDLMLALVNDVLDLSAIEAGKRDLTLEDLDPAILIHYGVRTFQTLAEEKNIALTADLAADLPLLKADRRAVLQIVLNLVSNAIKFTEPGGRVAITAAPRDGGVAIIVKDSGAGIPADVLPSVTEPFTRTHSNPHLAQAGTGLGLSIVKALTQAHGGRLTIASRQGMGTKVTVLLPFDPESARIDRAP